MLLNQAKLRANKFGKSAESYACDLLKLKGYKIINRNFRSRFGEIDIVALDNDTLVFVEVKARWSNKFGASEEAVTQQKIRKITRTGEYYSILNPELPKKLRIDVVALQISAGNVVSAKIINID